MSKHVERTRTRFDTRFRTTLSGAVFGGILGLIAIGILFWNEGRARKRYLDLAEGEKIVVAIKADKVDPKNEGELVHLSAETTTGAPLVDPEFGVRANGIRLTRTVEMYQWVETVEKETENKTGGGTETTTTYTYSRKWLDELIDSSEFHVPDGHRNPAGMPFRSLSVVAEEVSFGPFVLPSFLVARLGGGPVLEIDSLSGASEKVRQDGRIVEGGVYFGTDPAEPEVGDLRVTFRVAPTGPVSVIAKQAGETFETYPTRTGNTLDLIERGTKSAEEMFASARTSNKVMTWALRILGFLMLAGGIHLVLRPLTVLADVIPFIGNIVGAGTGLFSILLAIMVWTVTVGFAWLFYRPVVGILVLLATVATAWLALRLLKKARDREDSASPTHPPSATEPPPLS